MPIEFSTTAAGFGLAAEVGRSLRSGDGTNQWVVGIVAAHGCAERVECLAEVHQTQRTGVHLTLLNVGLRWKLPESLALLAAAGREFGTRTEEGLQSLFYIGLQFTQ